MATPNQLPYKPRQRSRPQRPLPAPPPEEDVPSQNAFEIVQGFTSPPSPPQLHQSLPPPPPPKQPSKAHDNADDVDVSQAAAEVNKLSITPEGQDQTARVRPPVPDTAARRAASHINPYHSTLPSTELTPPTILTPLRAHYLKKVLVSQQISYELNLITDPVLGANALGLLGSPFVIPDAVKRDVVQRVGHGAIPDSEQIGDLPFIRFMFNQFVLPFPFLASASPTFWSQKVQPFLSSFLATTGQATHSTLSDEQREISDSLMTKEERKEAEERQKLWTKVEKHVAMMLGVGIKLVGGEEVVRIGQSELRRIEQAHEARRKKVAEKHRANNQPEYITFDVNVVGVRSVREKHRVRSKSHEEFIIRTQRTGVPDVFVSRRYGDFRRLAEELRLAFPDAELPAPPPKDKTVTTAPVIKDPGSYGYSAYNPLRMIYGSGSPADSGASTPRESAEMEHPDPEQSNEPGPLTREKNRLTLRAYLQNILTIFAIANSPIMRSFLLSGQIQLTPREAADVQRRLEADAVREEGRRRFGEEAERRVEKLREGLAQFKGDVLSREGGLESVFEIVRRVERVEDLPPAEKSVLEWGRISLAATIFNLYVASDTASESFTSLKRMHGIMPYFVMKGILKISNPIAMIRGFLDLFLARPFGGQSLLQKMFSQALTEDVRYLNEDIIAVAEKVDDPVLCQKIEQYVNSPFEAQETIRREAVSENHDLLVVILRSPDMPALSRPQMQRVFKASRAYRQYKAEQAEYSDSDDEGPEDEDAWLFEDLNILMKIMQRKREKEAMISLIFEGVTAELLKDIITIFYSPLAQVYKAANIADSLGDLQAFINDMIRTVEQVEELSQEDPGRTVQTFIDLVQRHEQSFYTFVHNVHSKGHGLFDSLMRWIELFLSFARDGLAQPLDLEILLPMDGPQRAAIMKEVDDIAQYHYKLKVAHEEKVRRRFQSGAGADQQTIEEAALVDSVMQSLSIGDTILGTADEIAVEESEEEWDDESESSSLRSSQPGDAQISTPDGPPPVPPKDGRKHHKRRRKVKPVLSAPDAPHIAELRPLFVEIVKQLLVVKPLE